MSQEDPLTTETQAEPQDGWRPLAAAMTDGNVLLAATPTGLAVQWQEAYLQGKPFTIIPPHVVSKVVEDLKNPGFTPQGLLDTFFGRVRRAMLRNMAVCSSCAADHGPPLSQRELQCWKDPEQCVVCRKLDTIGLFVVMHLEWTE